MNVPKWISPLFWFAALYDGVLGLLFLAGPGWVFDRFGVTPPNHFGYVQSPAALLLVFALMFIAIARDPVACRGMIWYGILLKVAYCGLTFYYWVASDVPWIWKPFAVVDLVMGLLFAVALVMLKPKATG